MKNFLESREDFKRSWQKILDQLYRSFKEIFMNFSKIFDKSYNISLSFKHIIKFPGMYWRNLRIKFYILEWLTSNFDFRNQFTIYAIFLSHITVLGRKYILNYKDLRFAVTKIKNRPKIIRKYYIKTNRP